MPQLTLDSLSLDILYNILSYLYQGPHTKAHSYIVLSAVSKHLNNLIEDYTNHILATRFAQWSISRSGTIPPQRPTCRQRLLRHVWKHCEFCNQRSSRRAILADAIICCKNCDRREWEEKITMTDACKKYCLKQPDLFSANIRFGQYYGVTGLTTLFLEPEVRRLATRIHGGDLVEFLARRTTQSLERKAKQEKLREAKKAHLSSVLIANGLTDTNLVDSLSPFLYAGSNKRPAMSVLEIVRIELLGQRVEIEDQNVQLHSNKVHNSCDKTLFELFCKEFGLLPGGRKEVTKKEHKLEDGKDTEVEKDHEMRLRFYEFHSRRWGSAQNPKGASSRWDSAQNPKDALWMQKQSIITPSRRDPWEMTVTIRSEPPWSWACYPVLVKDATVDCLEQSTTVLEDPKKLAEKEKESRKINRWNAGAEKEMARISVLINERGLDKDLWHKVGGHTHAVEEAETGVQEQQKRVSQIIIGDGKL